ncbi:dihydrodipicolinate synthase family protein [Mesorhizobium sp. SARCC-RB16n]|uniref:dihydrodipicolinate synthase family protein n=1 Tax=Mesorhizobium sp. SARCC-RB16n TaxID=2116687 RepID=UPI00122F6F71|nr:dihydrodipicolinate synthase family protein [Mesorhizobium sp. SARCC-RB16n]KAA3447949.1 dihydrodipicolinate synthase family protein [Mesorhizobium sp. SARCC-RB16n]
MSFKGIIPPVTTPFHSDGSIDRDGLCVMVEHLVSSGVHGIIVGGTTGEYYAQSRDERVGLLKLAKTMVKGKVPLIAGVGAIRTEDCIEYALVAKDLKYNGILIGAPYYAVPTQLELANHALAIDKAANLPVMLYNYPGRTGTMMDLEFLDRVGRSSNFCAIKESSGSMNQLHALARDYPHIDLFCGMDDQALEFFAWGAKGWVCGAGNCLPAEHIALYEACVIEKDFTRGRRIMSALLPLMRLLEQGGKFVQSIKFGCELAGLPAGPVRRPMRELDEQHKRELETTIRTLKAVIASITAKPQKKAAENVIAINA